MAPWDGKERRVNNNADHDLLTRIDTNLDNYLNQFKEHKGEFSVHLEDDKGNFGKIDKELTTIQKFIWVATGIIVCIEFFSRIIR